MANILVVDDDSTVRDVVARILNMMGHTAYTYQDPELALASVNFSNIDLILTDYQMPMPGNEFIQILRDQDIDIPVIILSGTKTPEMVQTLDVLGVQKFLEKPFSIHELRDTICALLRELEHVC